MKYSVLKSKKVVLLANGQIIGCIVDFKFDPCTHVIEAYYVKAKQPCYKRFCQILFPSKVYEVKVEEICQIGDDLIFIEK